MAPSRLAQAVGCSLLLVIVACGSQDQEKQFQKVQLLIDWKAEPTYAGFYLADQLGEFSKRGLDVDIVEGNGATTSAQVIGTGATYIIGSCSGAATAIARSRGIPIRSVAVYYPNVPTVLYSRADTPIRTPQDMIGRRIGLITGSITVDEYRGVLAANAIDRDTIKEVSVGWDVATLLTGKVDGLMNYEELTPVQLRLQGYDIVKMRFRDFGVRAYSLNLIVNEAAAEEHHRTIVAVIESVNAGYRYLRDKPEDAARIFSGLFPEKNPEYVRQSIAIVASLLGEGKIGLQTREGWQETIDTLDRLGLLDSEISVDDIVQRAFLSD